MTCWLNEWRNDQWIATLESINPEDHSLWRVTKRVMRVSTLFPSGHLGGIALSESDKTETIADSMETQFWSVTDSSVPAVIEIFDVAQKSYFLTI